MTSKERNFYNTDQKKIAAIKKKGNIITFKERWAYGNGNAIQIIVTGFKKTKEGSVKIEGRAYDSNWYKSMDEMLHAIDWDFMNRNYEPDKRDYL